MNIAKIFLGTVAFFVSSFVIQGILGYAIAGNYFMSIPIMRQSPILYLSMLPFVLAGMAVSILYPLIRLSGSSLVRGLKFGFLVGLILVPFIAFDLPGRFEIPFVEKWILLQGILGFLHSIIAGILISFIYRKEAEL